MGQLIIIEVLEKSGKVKERSRHDHFPVRIGRSYQNEIILDDVYISPNHLSIEVDGEGFLQVRDLNSENGAFLLPSSNRITQVPVKEETLLRVGHTTIRIRLPHFQVGPTRGETPERKRVWQLVQGPKLFLVMLLLTGAAMVLDSYLSRFTKLQVADLLEDVFLSFGLLVLWAGFWALISKLNRKQSFFVDHGTVACTAILGLLVSNHIYEYLVFVFSAFVPKEFFLYGVLLILLGLTIYGHLRFSILQPSKNLAIITAIVSITIVGLGGTVVELKSTQFSTTLNYPAQLKPLPLKLVYSSSIDDFFKRAETVKRKADQAVKD